MKIRTLLIFLFASLFCRAQDWNAISIGTTEDLNQVYFIDNDIGFIIGNNGTLFKSIDGGNTWMSISSGVTHDLRTISFANQNVGFINGLKTIDGGDTWSAQPSSQGFALIKALDEQNLISGDYTSFQGEIFKSSDGGLSWVVIADPIDTGFYTDEFFVNTEVGYMTSWYSGRLIKTIDGGVTWDEIGLQPLIQFSDCEGVAFPTMDIGVIASGAHIIKTIDGGATWFSIYSIWDNTPQFSPTSIFAISENNYIVVGGNFGGAVQTIFETTDGGTSWVLSNASANRLEDVVCINSDCYTVGKNGTVLFKEIVIDTDGDGYALADDCDDNNPNVNPGQPEVPYNGLDDDCDPSTLDDDLDQDGYLLVDDCDDTNPNVNSGESEVPYNGIDDDCDPATLDDDLDQDGYLLVDDCDDTNPNVNSGESEVPYNGIDDDCDPATLDDDLDQDGFALQDDCDDENPNVNPDAAEVTYNGIDDDCDPATLDDDLDQDGFALQDDCDDENQDVNPDAVEVPYNGIDDDCEPSTLDDDLDQDGFSIAEDCNDDNPEINPDAEEIPDNEIDEDCDGMDLISSIHEIGKTAINIYPNPASSFIYVDAEEALDFSMTLFDLDGRMIKKLFNTNKMEVNSTASGIYLLEVKVIESSETVIEKIIIRK